VPVVVTSRVAIMTVCEPVPLLEILMPLPDVEPELAVPETPIVLLTIEPDQAPPPLPLRSATAVAPEPRRLLQETS
jgi:hypothetical protein